MGMIWRMATPPPEDHQTQDGTSYKWLDYYFSRHSNAQCIIEILTKDDERDLRVQGKVHVPNIYIYETK